MADPDFRSPGIAPPDGPVAFPMTPDEFDADPRISFSKPEQKWVLEENDGTEWEFDETLNRWILSLDQGLMEQQRQAYIVPGVDESVPVPPREKTKKRKKREQGDPRDGARENTAVYVTSIPLDATFEEIESVFSKYGLIQESLQDGAKRIKLYTDDEGNFKGEALIVYFRPESVQLAIDMLDDSHFRLGQSGAEGKMKVTVADRSYKRQKEAPTQPDKRAAKSYFERMQKLKGKLADWSDDDDEPSTLSRKASRYDRVVVLKHMFTLQELEEDEQVGHEIKEDIMEEGIKFGEVEQVTMFDLEPDGVAIIKFIEPSAAKDCAEVMNGRSFDGRTVKAYISDGKEFFKKKKKTVDEEDEDRRLAEYGKKLEEGKFAGRDGNDTGKDNGDKPDEMETAAESGNAHPGSAHS